MSAIIKGIYKYNKTGNLYNVIGTGRSVDNPNKIVVIYEQLYETNLRGTDIVLEKGSIWVRDLESFNLDNKFTKVE